MKFVPKSNKVVLLLDCVEEKMVGRIYLPGKHSENCRLAKILAVGPEVTDYKPGERVLINFFAGKVLDIFLVEKKGDDTLRVVTDEEILVGVTGEETVLDLSVQPALVYTLSIWKKIKLVFKIFFMRKKWLGGLTTLKNI